MSRLTYLFVLVLGTDFKVERKHVEGSDTGETRPELEHITEETVERMKNPGKVVVCKSSAKKDVLMMEFPEHQ
jgi:hypothetical protein